MTPDGDRECTARAATAELHRCFCSDVPNDGTYTLHLNETETIRFFAEADRLIAAHTRAAVERETAAKDAEIARLKIFEKWCQSNEVAEALEDVKLYRKTFETSVSKSVYDAANDALLASRRACEEAVGDARFWKNLHEMRLVEIPEPKNPTLWRYLEDSNNNGVIDYHIRAQKMSDGGFKFYIHAAQASSSTEDFYIWPDPFNWHDMVANTKDIPEPDVESFKKALAKAKLAPAPAGGKPAEPTKPRYLPNVLRAIIALAPDTADAFQSVLGSADYAAPENMAMWWQEATNILNREFANHPKAQEIAAIFNGQPTPPAVSGERGQA